MRKRRLELANCLEPLRIRESDVVRIERQGEETPLVRIANDEKLLGPWLAKERFHMRAHPADLGSHRLQQRHGEDAVPLVGFLVLEVDEVEHIDWQRQVSLVELSYRAQVELVEQAHGWRRTTRGARTPSDRGQRGVLIAC